MGFHLNPFKHHYNMTAQPNTMVAMTEQGKLALDRMDVYGRSYALMLALDEHSPMSMGSLSREARMDLHATEREMKRLQSQGMVRVVNYQEERS